MHFFKDFSNSLYNHHIQYKKLNDTIFQLCRPEFHALTPLILLNFYMIFEAFLRTFLWVLALFRFSSRDALVNSSVDIFIFLLFSVNSACSVWNRMMCLIWTFNFFSSFSLAKITSFSDMNSKSLQHDELVSESSFLTFYPSSWPFWAFGRFWTFCSALIKF